MIYIDPDGNYPRFRGDIELAHPSWTKGDDLPEGWILVQQTEPPTTTTYQVAEETAPELVEGVYQQIWVVREMTSEEIERVDAPETLLAKLQTLTLNGAEKALLSVGVFVPEPEVEA